MRTLELEVLWWNLSHDPRRMRTALKKLRAYDVKKKDGHFSARMMGREIDLTMYHLVNSINELEMWEKQYLPMDLRGKTVLDAGAGCGETALFFLEHGAIRVVAIEKDDSAHSLLRSNSQDLPIEVLPCMPFSLEHLQVPHDFLKMDIEGGEVLLLQLPRSTDLGPCVIEAHRSNDRALPEKLQAHLGLTKYHEIDKNAVLLTNVDGASHNLEQ